MPEEGGLALRDRDQTLENSFSAGWLAGKPDYPQKLKVPEGSAVSKPIFVSEYFRVHFAAFVSPPVEISFFDYVCTSIFEEKRKKKKMNVEISFRIC